MMQNNIKIAITGGICSGKSTVANIIREQGYKVISCDKIYADLLSNQDFIDKLDKEFGNIKNADGTLNRSKLSEIVFNDSTQLKKLNSLTHPHIMRTAMAMMTGIGIFFCEVPLLFEGGFERLFDNAIVVLRKKEERVIALMKRGKLEENQAFLRIINQFDYESNAFAKYYVIHNSGNLFDLQKKTLNTVIKIRKDYT